jgi:hypothetical protein
VTRVNKADGMGAVDRLNKRDMEEDILNVELVHGPPPGDGQSQYSPDSKLVENKLFINHLLFYLYIYMQPFVEMFKTFVRGHLE